mmetsp:Transcript_114099/g.369047  ORF Transcript_114099/g.369047 Transcript_114099/m.369047 type:complete len:227 (-) Transcript_114099:425-1105(-)
MNSLPFYASAASTFVGHRPANATVQHPKSNDFALFTKPPACFNASNIFAPSQFFSKISGLFAKFSRAVLKFSFSAAKSTSSGSTKPAASSLPLAPAGFLPRFAAGAALFCGVPSPSAAATAALRPRFFGEASFGAFGAFLPALAFEGVACSSFFGSSAAFFSLNAARATLYSSCALANLSSYGFFSSALTAFQVSLVIFATGPKPFSPLASTALVNSARFSALKMP